MFALIFKHRILFIFTILLRLEALGERVCASAVMFSPLRLASFPRGLPALRPPRGASVCLAPRSCWSLTGYCDGPSISLLMKKTRMGDDSMSRPLIGKKKGSMPQRRIVNVNISSKFINYLRSSFLPSSSFVQSLSLPPRVGVG